MCIEKYTLRAGIPVRFIFVDKFSGQQKHYATPSRALISSEPINFHFFYFDKIDTGNAIVIWISETKIVVPIVFTE